MHSVLGDLFFGNHQEKLLVVCFEPGSQCRLVAADFIFIEIQTNFSGRSVCSIGGMNKIHLATATEITSNRSRGCLQSAGSTQHFPNDMDDIQSLQNHRNDGSAGDEGFQARIKRLLNVFMVMLFR